MIAYKHLLTAKQKQQILGALQTENGVVIKPTKTQSGGFLGTLLASIGVPLLLNALTGKGLHVDRNPPTKLLPVYVPHTSKSKSKSKSKEELILLLGKNLLEQVLKKTISKSKKGRRLIDKPSEFSTKSTAEQNPISTSIDINS